MCLDLPALEEFGENSSDSLSDNIINQARDLTIAVYTSKVVVSLALEASNTAP